MNSRNQYTPQISSYTFCMHHRSLGEGGLPPWGVLWGGGRYPPWDNMLYGKQPGGTHPTGMHSCFRCARDNKCIGYRFMSAAANCTLLHENLTESDGQVFFSARESPVYRRGKYCILSGKNFEDHFRCVTTLQKLSIRIPGKKIYNIVSLSGFD